MIEICCNSSRSALCAKAGGATRIELCSHLEVGGITPSEDDIDYCVKELGLRTHVLVRPRAGDFCYSEAEYDHIKRQVTMCGERGAAAVVVGFLHRDGSIDTERTSEIVRMAAPMEVTFHRAFDECLEPLEALEKIIDCGCHRLLTSGCQPFAEQGIPLLRQLVSRSHGRILIMAGAGVTPLNARRIAEETGVDEIHGSCKHILASGEVETDEQTVRKLLDVFDKPVGEASLNY